MYKVIVSYRLPNDHLLYTAVYLVRASNNKFAENKVRIAISNENAYIHDIFVWNIDDDLVKTGGLLLLHSHGDNR